MCVVFLAEARTATRNPLPAFICMATAIILKRKNLLEEQGLQPTRIKLVELWREKNQLSADFSFKKILYADFFCKNELFFSQIPINSVLEFALKSGCEKSVCIAPSYYEFIQKTNTPTPTNK